MQLIRTLLAFTGFILSLVLVTSLAADMADGDGDDLKGGEDSAWWIANGKVTFAPGAYDDGGTLKYHKVNYFYYTADHSLNGTHVQTSAGSKLRHRHAVPPLTNTPPYTDLDKVNLFYDYYFGAKDTPKKAERASDATLKTNCHAFAFGTLASGTYDYWFDSGAVTTALNDDCDRKDKSAVRSGDLLVYIIDGEHTTVVEKAGSDYKTQTLKWKGGVSGVYRMYNVSGSFDTPRYSSPQYSKTGEAMDLKDWTWMPAGMGSGDLLWGGPKVTPGTSVWRKK